MVDHYTRAAESAKVAMELVRGDRRETHGDFKHNFAAIASLWNGYLQAQHLRPLGAEDVAHMMVLLKIARTLRGAHNNDDYVDAIGYAMIAAGLAKPTEPNN